MPQRRASMYYITTNSHKTTEYQNQKNIVYGKAEEKKPLKILKTSFLIFILSIINGWTGTTTASPSVIVLITTDGWRKTRLHRMAIP